jgi:hypothetical protein
MTICVIENIPEHNRAYILALRQHYENAKVVPEADQACQTWKEAFGLIKKIPKREEAIFVLDLALNMQGDADEGIQHAESLRLDRKDAIIIALTSFAAEVRQYKRAKYVFDAIVDKQDPSLKDPEQFRHVLYREIERAQRAKKTVPKSSEPNIVIEDSLGMRLAEAAITTEGVRELVDKEAGTWRDIRVRALTSGNSGAHLLRVSGTSTDQPAQLVLKIAIRRSVLEDEARALSVEEGYGARLGHFSAKVPQSSKVESLMGRQVFYFRQVSVPGDTLYDLIRTENDKVIEPAFRSLLQLLVAQYREYSSPSGSRENRDVSHIFGFRPDHPYRIQSSCDRLLPAATLLARDGLWPRILPNPTVIFSAVRYVTDHWKLICSKTKVALWAVQHGDLHAGNVIVKDGQLSFIDLARLGPWPLGYDISRLATHARVHLPSQKADRDWIMNDLSDWIKDEFGSLEHHKRFSVCKWANFADIAFVSFVNDQKKASRADIVRLYQMSTLSDLLRIISYSTLSHFKRIWVAIAIWQLADRLNIVNQKGTNR